jgi:ankyrin repeat protein
MLTPIAWIILLLAANLVHADDSRDDFLAAVRAGDHQLVAEKLAVAPTLIWRTDDTGQSALHIAASQGDEDLARLLLDRGLEPDFMRRGVKMPSLQVALLYDHIAVAKLLIARGASVNATDSIGRPILHALAKNGKSNAIRMLVEHGADVNKPDAEGVTAVYRAVEWGHVDTVRTLLVLGAKVQPDMDQAAKITTHLRFGEDRKKCLEMLQILDEAGAGVSVLRAVYQEDVEGLRAILDKDPDAVRRAEEGGQTLMTVAMSADLPRVKLIRMLVEHGAATNQLRRSEYPEERLSREDEHAGLSQRVLGIVLPHWRASPVAGKRDRPSNSPHASWPDAERLRIPGPAFRFEHVLLGLGGSVTIYQDDLFYSVSNVGGKKRFEAEIDEPTTTLRLLEFDGKTQITLHHFDDGIRKSAEFSSQEELRKANEPAARLLEKIRNREVVRRSPTGGFSFVGSGSIEGFAILGDSSRVGNSPLCKIYDLELLTKLLKDLPHIANQTDGAGVTPIFYAAAEGHLEVVKLLLENGAIVENPGSRTGLTPLHAAAAAGRTEMLKFLLAKGAQADVRDRLNCTPLMLAVLGGHVEAVKVLLENGADPYRRPVREDRSPLMIAVEEDRLDLVKELVAKHKNFADDGHKGTNSLVSALETGNAEIAAFLLEAGVPIGIALGNPPLTEAQHKDKAYVAKRFHRRLAETALFVDTALGKVDKVEKLLDEFPDFVNLRHPKIGCSALVIAAIADEAQVAELLLKHGADPNAIEPTSVENTIDRLSRGLKGLARGSSVHWAASLGNTAVLRTLIASGGDIESPALSHQEGLSTATGDRPLHVAALQQNTAVLELLKAHGARIDGRNMIGETPLHCAARAGNDEAAAWLLANGANARIANEQGDTPLHVTASSGSTAIAEMLLKQSVDFAIENSQGLSPLEVAARNQNRGVALALVNAGQTPDVMTAILVGKHDLLERLLTEDPSRASAPTKGDNVVSPLVQAARMSDLAAMAMLLRYKADVSPPVLHTIVSDVTDFRRPTIDGITADKSARERFAIEAVKLLVQHGADINGRDRRGKTPLDGASFAFELRKYIEQLGGRREYELDRN